MRVEPRIERNIQRLAARLDNFASIWLSGSRANGGEQEASEEIDWDLVVFGSRGEAEAMEAGDRFVSEDMDIVFVDLQTNEFKRLWKSAGWESFASWYWTELSPAEAEYHSAHFSDQLVMMGGEWVDAGALSVTRKKARKLWPKEPFAPVPDLRVN
jgi:hypothetical protein